MSHPIIALSWNKLSHMAHALNSEYSGIAVDFYRAGIMKMTLEGLTSTEVSIDGLLGRPYGLHSCVDKVVLTLPFSEDELRLLTDAGHDLNRMDADEVGSLFQRVYADLGHLELDVGIDGALPENLNTGALKAIRSNNWGAYLLTHVRDEETGAWMACPPSPLFDLHA